MSLILEQLLKHPWVIGDCAKHDIMDAEVVSRLQSFNARKKFRAAAIASVWSSKMLLRTKKLRNLLGSHDLMPEELENLRIHFKRMWVLQALFTDRYVYTCQTQSYIKHVLVNESIYLTCPKGSLLMVIQSQVYSEDRDRCIDIFHVIPSLFWMV